jgi:hypothetical protein
MDPSGWVASVPTQEWANEVSSNLEMGHEIEAGNDIRL